MCSVAPWLKPSLAFFCMLSLQEYLDAEKFPPQFTKVSVDGGWDVDSFCHVVSDSAALDGVLDQLLPQLTLNLLAKSKLHSAWTKVQSKAVIGEITRETKAGQSTAAVSRRSLWQAPCSLE